MRSVPGYMTLKTIKSKDWTEETLAHLYILVSISIIVIIGVVNIMTKTRNIEDICFILSLSAVVLITISCFNYYQLFDLSVLSSSSSSSSSCVVARRQPWLPGSWPSRLKGCCVPVTSPLRWGPWPSWLTCWMFSSETWPPGARTAPPAASTRYCRGEKYSR